MLKKWYYTFQLKRRKKQADQGKFLTKMPHYVIKWHGKLVVVSSRKIRNMKKRGHLTKDFTWMKLQESAIYKTN